MFGAQARFATDQVRVSGRSTAWVRTADSGNRLIFHFCPVCGATVYYWLESKPDITAVPIGAFADSSFPAPKFSVYESRRHAWVKTPDGVGHSD